MGRIVAAELNGPAGNNPKRPMLGIAGHVFVVLGRFLWFVAWFCLRYFFTLGLFKKNLLEIIRCNKNLGFLLCKSKVGCLCSCHLTWTCDLSTWDPKKLCDLTSSTVNVGGASQIWTRKTTI